MNNYTNLLLSASWNGWWQSRNHAKPSGFAGLHISEMTMDQSWQLTFTLRFFFCSKFKRKPRGWKHTGKTGTKFVMQSKMVTFHYFARYCRCHSNCALKIEYGAVKMVLCRAKIPDRRSCSVGSRVESYVWNPQQNIREPVMQGDSLGVLVSALPERETITRHLNYGKPRCRAIWREIGKGYGRWGGEHSWDT